MRAVQGGQEALDHLQTARVKVHKKRRVPLKERAGKEVKQRQPFRDVLDAVAARAQMVPAHEEGWGTRELCEAVGLEVLGTLRLLKTHTQPSEEELGPKALDAYGKLKAMGCNVVYTEVRTARAMGTSLNAQDVDVRSPSPTASASQKTLTLLCC